MTAKSASGPSNSGRCVRGAQYSRAALSLILTFSAIVLLVVGSCEVVCQLGLPQVNQSVALGPLHVLGSWAFGLAIDWPCVHVEVARRTRSNHDSPGWIHHPRTLFSFASRSLGSWRHYWGRAPLLLVVAVFLAYPLWVYITRPYERWRRRCRGLCVVCAYDLTGNTSGVCPECGTPTPQQ